MLQSGEEGHARLLPIRHRHLFAGTGAAATSMKAVENTLKSLSIDTRVMREILQRIEASQKAVAPLSDGVLANRERHRDKWGMSILYHPQVGTILRVDLNEGFRTPEMRKRRPAIVMSPKLPGRDQLCTIVPLSTTPPNPARPYNCVLDLDPPLPFPYDAPRMWVKADMVMCVAFHRLKLLDRGKNSHGERVYDVRVIDADKLEEIRACIRHSLGM
jgi:mRNA interferase MazF